VSDLGDRIAKIIAEAERAAYERGWRDSRAAMIEAADQLRGPGLDSDKLDLTERISRVPRGRRPSNAIQIVSDCILATPGMRGVEVVKAAQSIDASIKERTVRTCLRRLHHEKKTIWQRNGRWYPKLKEKTGAENEIGEAAATLPH
jgi:hypothetical protein